MKRIAVLLVFVLPVLSLSAEPTFTDRVRAALALAQAPSLPQAPVIHVDREWCQCEPCVCEACTCSTTYEESYEKAIQRDLVLFVYVAQKARRSDYAVVCAKRTLGMITHPCVVVGVPDGKGGLNLAATFDGLPSDAKLTAFAKEYRAKMAVAEKAAPRGDLIRATYQPVLQVAPSFGVRANCASGG